LRHEFDENCLAFSFKSNIHRKNTLKFDRITAGSGLRHEFNDNYLEQRKHTSKFGSITAEREGLTLKGIETSIRHEIIRGLSLDATIEIGEGNPPTPTAAPLTTLPPNSPPSPTTMTLMSGSSHVEPIQMPLFW